EILAVRKGRADSSSCTGYEALANTEYESAYDGYCYQLFSPDASRDVSFRAYIAPPKGNGWSTYDKTVTILQPGEEMTIGFPMVSIGSTGTWMPGYPTRMCTDRLGSGQPVGTTFEVDNFRFIYTVTVDGEKVVKKEIGTSPLVLPCETSSA
ncbi:MAG: hypothetical protein NT051_00500, partial [Candidatus Micrarchaeota archaeon]|nr:hypothetical protein [Candidatus Micrarchaeota archaeon]